MKKKINGSKPLFYSHILIIFLGAALFLCACFQNNVWFDEAFTIGLIQNDFFEMIKVSVFDVHPPLYYIMLKIFTLIFGTSYASLRIFSAIGAILLCLTGLTHIRKDFGEKTGFYFSLLAVLFSSILTYAVQIRMYTWAALFVTLAAIYAYRMFQKPEDRKTRIKFIILTVASAYTHHFALFAVGMINFLLLLSAHKQKSYKNWIVNAAWQIGLFLPGLGIFFYQGFKGGGGGWQKIIWPDLISDFCSYHLLGQDLSNIFDAKSGLFKAIGGLFYLVYLGILLLFIKVVKENNEESKPAKYAAYTYYGVMAFVLSASIFYVIYYIRYTFVTIGLLIFMTAWLLAHLKQKTVKALILLFFVTVFGIRTVGLYQTIYDPSKDAVKNYLSDKLEEDDIFIFSDIKNYSVTVNYQKNKSVYYHTETWGPDAYKAFQTNSEVITDIENCDEINSHTGRFWVIDKGPAYSYLVKQKHGRVIEKEYIPVKYQGLKYTFYLIEVPR